MKEFKPDLMLTRMALEKHLEQVLDYKFHGWETKPSLTCRNLYMNGHDHFCKIEVMARYCEGTFRLVRWEDMFCQKELTLINDYLKNPVGTLSRWVRFLVTTIRCPNCGHKLELETDGQVIRVAGDPCQYPNGYPEWTVQINVPSGRLVMANSLHSWFPQVDTQFHKDNLDPTVISDISTAPGAHLYASRYADAGMLVGFTGNECPGVYRATGRNDKFVVGQSAIESGLPIEGTEEQVASICTDFWGFSMADESRLLKARPDHPLRETVIDVPPGWYRMTYHRHRIADLQDDTVDQVYATIERVGGSPMSATTKNSPT